MQSVGAHSKGCVLCVAPALPARGQAFLNTTYKHLGEKEVDDQIAAAKFFATQSYVDAQRIGMWGWSFGGYVLTHKGARAWGGLCLGQEGPVTQKCGDTLGTHAGT